MSVSVARFEIAQAKLSDYLLDPSHPRGGPKARFLVRHGFARAYPSELEKSLRRHVVGSRRREDPNAFGIFLVFEGPLTTPDGRNPRMRTVWQVETGSDVAQFVTAYPLR